MANKASAFVTPEQHGRHLRAERLRGLQLITSSNLTTGTRPPLAHHWLTVDFTDEIGNVLSKELRKFRRDFPNRSVNLAWGDIPPQSARSRTGVRMLC
jgi:hypothetical protein